MNVKLYFVLPFILQATLWRILMRPFFYLFTRFEVHGLESIKNLPRGAVFAPNHSSELDSVLLPLAFPLWSKFSPMFYIVREPNFYTDPVFSWRRHFYDFVPFKALGAYSIVSGVKDYALSLDHHCSILKDGGAVCIFPEGGFTKTGVIGQAHGGVSYLAHRTESPIVPVLIEGTFALTPKNMFLWRRRVSVTFLPPLYARDHLSPSASVEEYRALAERVLDALRAERARVLAEGARVVETDGILTKPSNVR